MFRFGLIQAESGARGYRLRVPIKTLGKEPIEGLAEHSAAQAHDVTVRLSREAPYIVFTAGDFATEESALSWLPRLRRGIWALALRFNVAFRAEFTPRSIVHSHDPEQAADNVRRQYGLNPAGPIFGVVEMDDVVVYPANQSYLLVGLRELTGIVSTGAAIVLPLLETALKAGPNGEGEEGEDFRTAMDLYVSHFYETSLSARLLTLVTALEVLSPNMPKHQRATELVARWHSETRELLGDEQDDEARHALESLLRELDFRKETSIRRRVRQLVLDTFQDSPDEAARLAKEAVAVYDMRGTLTHEGRVPSASLSESYSRALELLRRVLASRLGMAELLPASTRAT